MAAPPNTDAKLLPLYEVDGALLPLYEQIADCPNCELARTRSRTVPGSGPSTAEIMFVGEAPGKNEDELGLPFVGASGRFLDELLASAGLSRQTVYICNVVKCRPPNNADPEPQQIAACSRYLDRQIEIIDPKVIVTLGRFSMARWFSGATSSKIHGQPTRVRCRLIGYGLCVGGNPLGFGCDVDLKRIDQFLDRRYGSWTDEVAGHLVAAFLLRGFRPVAEVGCAWSHDLVVDWRHLALWVVGDGGPDGS